MSWIESIPGIGEIVKSITGIVSEFVTDKDKAAECATRIRLAVLDVLGKELASQYWLAANWRAIAMLGVTGCLVYRDVMDRPYNDVMLAIFVVGLVGYQLGGEVLKFINWLVAKNNQNHRKVAAASAADPEKEKP